MKYAIVFFLLGAAIWFSVIRRPKQENNDSLNPEEVNEGVLARGELRRSARKLTHKKRNTRSEKAKTLLSEISRIYESPAEKFYLDDPEKELYRNLGAELKEEAIDEIFSMTYADSALPLPERENYGVFRRDGLSEAFAGWASVDPEGAVTGLLRFIKESWDRQQELLKKMPTKSEEEIMEELLKMDFQPPSFEEASWRGRSLKLPRFQLSGLIPTAQNTSPVFGVLTKTRFELMKIAPELEEQLIKSEDLSMYTFP